MSIERTTAKHFWNLIPMWGIILFGILYVVATFYYPGGSSFNPNATGFSWLNNYWCNLLNQKAINGQANAAQPIALTAMFVISITLTFFWWQFPRFTNLQRGYKRIIQVCGTLAMVIGIGLFTKINHDLVTNLASLFGIIAMMGVFIGLYKNGWIKLFYFGLLNVTLVVLNNFLYYNKEFIFLLPMVQKITFAAFLIWICCIELRIYRFIKSTMHQNFTR